MAFLLSLVIVLSVVGACLYVVKAQRSNREPLADKLERTDEHEAMVKAMGYWLTDERIVQCILDQRVATKAGLRATLGSLDAMDEGTTRKMVAALLANKNVRRVIATYEASELEGIEKADVMKALYEWSQVTA